MEDLSIINKLEDISSVSSQCENLLPTFGTCIEKNLGTAPIPITESDSSYERNSIYSSCNGENSTVDALMEDFIPENIYKGTTAVEFEANLRIAQSEPLDNEDNFDVVENCFQVEESETSSDESFVDSLDFQSMESLCFEEIDSYNNSSFTPVKTKNETSLDDLSLPEPIVIEVPENAELKELGQILSIVKENIVVQSFSKIPILDVDTILFLRDKIPIGKIFDVFGPVDLPFYLLRVNREKQSIDFETLEKKLAAHVDPIFVYFVANSPQLTSFVFSEQLKNFKGSDASWYHDEEPPEDVIEFSDDEKERLAKKEKLKKKFEKKIDTGGSLEKDHKYKDLDTPHCQNSYTTLQSSNAHGHYSHSRLPAQQQHSEVYDTRPRCGPPPQLPAFPSPQWNPQSIPLFQFYQHNYFGVQSLPFPPKLSVQNPPFCAYFPPRINLPVATPNPHQLPYYDSSINYPSHQQHNGFDSQHHNR